MNQTCGNCYGHGQVATPRAVSATLHGTPVMGTATLHERCKFCEGSGWRRVEVVSSGDASSEPAGLDNGSGN
ncbi:hypothetical protein AB0I81_24675 [Nonomuraea sp. NPDC050404]|uniref:hypothetical protein n=1 Tax=Nonomuraea sp. NPDC050404 TaxID=3155783 RepID=UPI0033D57623